MFILTGGTELKQGLFKLQQVLPVLTAWPDALVDLLSNIELFQSAKKLWVLGEAYVYEASYV